MENTKQKLIDTNLFIREPMEIYYSKRNDYLTAHQLKSFLGPPREKPDNVPDDIRKVNFMIGIATHLLVLEGRKAFDHEYATEGMKAEGRCILTGEQAEMVEQMNRFVSENALAQHLLGTGVAENVVRAIYRSFSCQIRPDWFNPYEGIIDLKTTDTTTSFDYEMDAYRYGNQLAFYRSVLKEAFGVIVPVYIIVVCKRESHCGVIQLSPKDLDIWTTENEEVMEHIRSTQIPGTWAGLA